MQVNPLGGVETRSVASLRYRRPSVTVMASDAVRRTVPCHDVRGGVPASWGGMLSAVLPDVGTRSVASLHVCIDHSTALQSKPKQMLSKPKQMLSKSKQMLSKLKQTQNMPKQNEANAIYTDTDTVTDTVTVSHSLTRARERNNPQ